MITVTVIYPSGEKENFEVISSNRVASLRKKIETSRGKHTKNWNLIFKDNPLGNDDTFDEQGIKSGSILRLQGSGKWL